MRSPSFARHVDTAERTHSSPEAMRLAGCTWAQIQYWDTARLVTPTTPTGGRGSPRRYTEAEVLRLALVKTLLDAGVTLMRARRVLATLADIALPDAAIIVLEHEHTHTASTVAELHDILATARGCVTVLALDTILRPVRARCAEAAA